MKTMYVGFILALLFSLSGCGGSSADGGNGKITDDKNIAPKIVIDAPKSAYPGKTVFLEAGRSYIDSNIKKNTSTVEAKENIDRKIISWQWQQSSLDKVQVFLFGADTSRASFVAPKIVLGLVDLHFSLDVVDDQGNIAKKHLSVRLLGDTENKPVAVVQPIQDYVRVAEQVQLDGSASYFDDGNYLHDKYSNIESYLWSQDARDRIRAVINNANSAIASFVVEDEFIGSEVLHFSLLIKDRHGRTGKKAFTVELRGDSENRPVSIIQPLDSFIIGETVELDGSKSFYDDGNPEHDKYANIKSYLWSQDSADTYQVDLQKNNQSKASFILDRDFIGQQFLHFNLYVTDKHGRSDKGSITIVVQGDSSNPPVAVIKGDNPRTVGLGELITLDGSDSYYDANDKHNKFDNIISYQWLQESTDEIQVSLTDSDKAITRFTTPESHLGTTTLNFTLTVQDKYERTASTSVKLVLEGRGEEGPLAIIVAPDKINQGEEITLLDGRKSYDQGKGGKIVAWKWTLLEVGDLDVNLNDDSEPLAELVAPKFFLGKHEVQVSLEVTDNDGQTATTTKTIVLVGKTAYSISGKVTISALGVMDTDINNPDAYFKSNDTIKEAQLINNKVEVTGYVNVANQGADGRSKIAGDRNDFYRITNAESGDTIQLRYSNEVTNTELSFHLYKVAGDTTEHLEVIENENTEKELTLPSSGDYIIRIYAKTGASNYKLKSVSDVSSNHPFSYGEVKVLLYDPALDSDFKKPVAIVKATPINNTPNVYSYSFKNIPVGVYALIAGTDTDNDNEYSSDLLDPVGKFSGVIDLVQDAIGKDVTIYVLGSDEDE